MRRTKDMILTEIRATGQPTTGYSSTGLGSMQKLLELRGYEVTWKKECP